MTEPLPQFDDPPVIETVLSAQFSQLPKFSNAHAGWFWKGFLPPEWETVQEAPRLADQYERFGQERSWGVPGGITIRPVHEGSERLQIFRSDNERLIQVQDTRFVYNWRKEAATYPSYGKLAPEFHEHFGRFQEFAKEAGNPEIELNQWEVTYVNHLPQGKLWTELRDWPQIFPGLYLPGSGVNEQEFDGFGGEWHLAMKDNIGRLHISMKHVRLGGEDGPEAIALQLTARGPIDKQKGVTLERGFDVGHESIVRSFTEMTSENAHKHWQRRA